MNERPGTRGEGPEEIRRDIERTRAEMSGTIDAIREKLDPDVLKARAKDKLEDVKDKAVEQVHERVAGAKHAVREATVGRMEDMVDRTKHGVRDAGSTVVDRIRENPIPAAMIGAGLAWLIFGGKKEERRALPRYGYDYEDEYGDYGYEGADAYGVESIEAEPGKAERWKAEAKAKAREVGERAEHRAHDVAVRARHGADDLQRRARHQAHRIESGFERTFRDNPIAIGAAALAVGTLVGMSLPHTEREDEALGKTRDKLLDKAQGLAREGLEKAKSKASEVAGATDQSHERASFPSRPSIGSA